MIKAEKSMPIVRYDAMNPIDDSTAEQVSGLFKRNYPPYYSAAARRDDMELRGSADRLRRHLESESKQRTLYVAKMGQLGTAAAFLEANTVAVEGGYFEMLSWIMVDETQRGQSLASLLHQHFIADASERARRRSSPSAATLNVHRDNPARGIYRRWGYEADMRPLEDKNMIFMRKPL
jgi:GNAT superfamily N-acetyltransferase